MDEFPENNDIIDQEPIISSKDSEMGESEEMEEISVEEQVEETTDRVDVLINLLIKKNLITEEELQAEYDEWITDKELEE